MKIEDKVIELISFNKFKEMQMLEDAIDELYAPVYGYEHLHLLIESVMNKITTEKIIDRKFFIYKYELKLDPAKDINDRDDLETRLFNLYLMNDKVPAFRVCSKSIPKEEQYVVDILHTNILDDMAFLTICNNIDFSKVKQKSLKLYTEDRRLSYDTYSFDKLVDYTARTARGYTTVIRVAADSSLVPLLPFLTKLEFVPIVETTQPN